MPEQLIGTVVHYFKGPSVAVVRVTEGELAVGDQVRFHGHTTDFSEQIASMERSEEHTSELQSQSNLVCRLLLEKKKTKRRPPRRKPSPPATIFTEANAWSTP